MVAYAAEHIGEPSAWIDVIQARGDDQRIHCSGALATTIRSGKQPSLTPEGDATKRAFRGVVAQTNAAIIEEAGEAFPPLQHIVHGLGDIGVAQKLARAVRIQSSRSATSCKVLAWRAA